MSERDPHEAAEEANEAVEERAVERAARQRVPSSFDLAFLSGAEQVTELLLVRHGQQSFNEAMSVGEFTDPPLSELGEQQARLVGMALSTERIDAVYASPLKRALETGREIARHHRLEVTVLPDIQEVGIYRDVPPDKTPLEYVGRLVLLGTRHRMMMEKTWDVYPYSEPGADFRRRVINAIEGIIATHPNQRVVIACHGGVINAYVGHVIGSKYDMFFRPVHTSINVVAAGDNMRALYRLNDYHHLETGEGSFHSV